MCMWYVQVVFSGGMCLWYVHVLRACDMCMCYVTTCFLLVHCDLLDLIVSADLGQVSWPDVMHSSPKRVRVVASISSGSRLVIIVASGLSMMQA